jgi:transposase
MAMGDGRDIQPDVSLGRASHQKSSQWPHGRLTHYLTHYLTQQAARLVSTVEWINEAYSTRTCRHSGLWRTGCGARVHRDVNGSANRRSKAAYGRSSKLQADTIKHRRPIGGVPLTRARSSWR